VLDLGQRQDDDDDDDEVDQTQDFTNEDSNSDNSSRVKPDYDAENQDGGTSFTTMTPHQIAKWIDKRSRVLFPVSFLVFSIVYWGFIVVDMAQENVTEET